MAEFQQALSAFDLFVSRVDKDELILTSHMHTMLAYLHTNWNVARQLGKVMDIYGIQAINIGFAGLAHFDDDGWLNYRAKCDALELSLKSQS